MKFEISFLEREKKNRDIGRIFKIQNEKYLILLLKKFHRCLNWLNWFIKPVVDVLRSNYYFMRFICIYI